MTTISLVIVLVALVAHTAGQIFLKHAMASTHSEAGFRSRACLIPFAIGIALMTTQFFLNLGLLQRYDLSFIYPFQGLGVIIIKVPALNERSDDIPTLTDKFLTDIAEEQRARKKVIEPKALQDLQKHIWTGNIRELRNVIERLVIMSDDKITEKDVKKYL